MTDMISFRLNSIKRPAVVTILALGMTAPNLGFAQDNLPDPEDDPTRVIVEDERLDPGQTVRDREQPAFEAKGIRAGRTVFYPDLSLRQSFTDNLFFEPSNVSGDLIGTISPHIRADVDLNKLTLTFGAGADILRHVFNPREDVENILLEADANYAALEGLDFSAGSEINLSHESRSAPDDVAANAPTPVRSFGNEFLVEYRPGRILGEVGFDATIIDYDDTSNLGVITNNDDRDRFEYGGFVKGGYEFVPGYSAFVRVGADSRDYFSRVDDAGIDRDSVGFRVDAGTEFELTNLITGEVSVGYLSRFYDNPGFSDLNGLAFDLDMFWYVTPLVTVFGSVERSVGETTTGGSSGILTTVGRIGADYEFKRNVLFGLNFSYGHDDYNGLNRLDRLATVGATADWKINPNFEVNVGIDYSDKGSDLGSAEYQAVATFVGLKLKL